MDPIPGNSGGHLSAKPRTHKPNADEVAEQQCVTFKRRNTIKYNIYV